MQLARSFAAGLCAVTLSLAGCAAPTGVPTSTAQTAPAAAPAATAAPAEVPAAQPAAPVMPAPAAVTATTLTGTASFRGELLSGYAVQVLNAQTGLPVELRNDLAGATGLAVLNQNLVTDAKGQFNLQVVGLTAGQALLVVATKNNVRVEAVVTSNMQSLGAKGYRVAQAGTAFTLTELTTAIAKVARGVLNATQVLTAEASAPVIAELAVEMAALSIKLELQLAANPSFGNQLLVAEGNDGDDAVKTLVSNAGQLQALTQTIAGMVSDIATAAKTGGSTAGDEAAVQARLALIPFIGTVLTGAFINNTFTLTNSVNGQSVDASTANLSSVTTQVSSSSSSSSVNRKVAEVNDSASLWAALADTSVTEILLTKDIRVTADTSTSSYHVTWVAEPPLAALYVSRDVIINGGDSQFKLAANGIYLGQNRTITLKNLSAASRIFNNSSQSAGYKVAQAANATVTFDHVSVFAPPGQTGLLLTGAGNVTVRDCQFTMLNAIGYGDGIIVHSNEDAIVSVARTTFTNWGTGISIESMPASLAISDCYFDQGKVGFAIRKDLNVTMIPAHVSGITNNRFLSPDSSGVGIRAEFYTGPTPYDPAPVIAKLIELNPFTSTQGVVTVDNFSGYADDAHRVMVIPYSKQ